MREKVEEFFCCGIFPSRFSDGCSSYEGGYQLVRNLFRGGRVG